MAKTAGRKLSARTAMTAEEARDHLRNHFDLIANIMSARRDADTSEEHFRTFERMFRHDYREFARTKDFPGEADAVSRLMTVFEHMRQIRLAPHLASRNICAVVGGFSSGKSSLLNRLMGTDMLPTKITPTTSIPTYVSHGAADDVTIEVFNRNGGSVTVEPDQLRQMTHGFGTIDGRGKGIPLHPIVDRVSVLTPSLQRWSNVAFVDTPGHTNSGDTDGVSQDEQIAEREALASRFLLAVVDCERGELSQQDIYFINRFAQKLPAETHDQPGRGRLRQDSAPIYVVLNKADKKESDRRSILKSVAATVERHEIPCFGVGLYSAHIGEWFEHERSTFDAFLQMIDGNPIRLALDADVESVFDDYAKFHSDERKEWHDLDGLLRRLQLERDDDEGVATGRTLGSDLQRHVDSVEQEIGRHDKAVEESRSLRDSFVQCTRSFMESVGLAKAPPEEGSGDAQMRQRKQRKGVSSAYEAAMRRHLAARLCE